MSGPPRQPDRYEPVPSLPELPRWLLRKLPPRLRGPVVALLVAALAAIVLVVVLVALPAAGRRDQRRRGLEARQLRQRLANVRAAQRPHRVVLGRAERRTAATRVAALDRAVARAAGTARARCTRRPDAPPASFSCDAIVSRTAGTVTTLPFAARLDPATGRGALCRRIEHAGVPTEQELRAYRIPAACGGG